MSRSVRSDATMKGAMAASRATPEPPRAERLEERLAGGVELVGCRRPCRARAAAAHGRPGAPLRGGGRQQEPRGPRSPFITARPSSVRMTTGRSAPREADPARRDAAAQEPRQPLARVLAEVAEGGRGGEAGALEPLVRIAVDERHRRLEPEAAVHARHARQRLAHDEASPPRDPAPARRRPRARQTSQRPQPWSVSASSPK